MSAESDLAFNLIVTEFQKLSVPKQKELLQLLIAKLDVMPENQATNQRIAGLHEGKGWISDDFDDELPDEFWGDRV